ncbi:MAG: hypothetical protein WCR04_10240, partial [Fibrobacteraceae bacterium]
MSVDVDSLISNVIGAAGNVAQNEGSKALSYIQRLFENEKETLKGLCDARLAGEINDAVFDQELDREKSVLEGELLTARIMSKAGIQKAVNAA